MKARLLAGSMMSPDALFVPPPTMTDLLPQPQAPKDDLLDALRMARAQVMAADADPRTWPREAFFEGRWGTLSPGPVGLEFRPYPREQG